MVADVALPAAIYCRISRDRTGLAAGVTRQEADCRQLAAQHGWEVLEPIYVDNDLSAYSGKRRPAYERLLEDVRAGTVGAVLAWHPDRLYRRTRELEGFIDAVEANGVKIATVQAGVVDVSTPSGRMVARALGVVSQFESEHKSERLKRKMLDLAREGLLVGGGARPFGFDEDRVTIRPDEADLIREAARRVLAGEPVRAICRDWDARGILTTTKGTWHPSPLGRILLSPRTAGLREHHGVTYPAAWPAILDAGTVELLGSFLRDPNRLSHHGTARAHLLTGLVRCGLCGARLRCTSSGRPPTLGYVCKSGAGFSGCGKIRRAAAPLEDWVRDAVFTRLNSPAVEAAAADAAQTDDAERQLLYSLQADETHGEQLDDYLADGTWSKSQYLRQRQRLDERIAATRKQLARRQRGRILAAVPERGPALDAKWKTESLAWRHQLLATLIDRVIVLPAGRGGAAVKGRFNPAKVQIIWCQLD